MHLKINTKGTASELVISKVAASHAGEYLVTIKNLYGEDLATATLTLEGKCPQLRQRDPCITRRDRTGKIMANNAVDSNDSIKPTGLVETFGERFGATKPVA